MSSMAATSVGLRAGTPLGNGQALEVRQASRDACSSVQPMCLNVGARHRQARSMPQQKLAAQKTHWSVASRHATQMSRKRQVVCAAAGLGSEDNNNDGNVKEFFDGENLHEQ